MASATAEDQNSVLPESCPVQKPKIKHDWYQTDSLVVITILLKNASKESVKVNYAERTLSVSAPVPGSEAEYSLELELRHPVVPDLCSLTVTASKLEVKLRKRDGFHWNLLEGEPENTDIKPIPQAVLDASGPPSGPKYPSSCSVARDWDKIEKDIIKQEAEEKPVGEAALKQLFEQIYGGGSDEVRKAMNKSYMESGGTVLSTNWNEVSKDKVEIKPPDGMEFKKWDN